MANYWQYSDSVDTTRQKRLLSVEYFSDVVGQIKREMSVLCYHRQPCDDDSGYARPVFCIQVPEELFDTFFNSPVGYRGSYFASPLHGLECNHRLMEALLPDLSSWARQNSPGYNASFIQEALLGVSAKAWLAECTMELCPACEGEWSRPSNDQAEIINGRWNTSNQPNSRYGRKAPLHSKIRLFGAFLNNRGDEFIPARKRHRDQHIHDEGWA